MLDDSAPDLQRPRRAGEDDAALERARRLTELVAETVRRTDDAVGDDRGEDYDRFMTGLAATAVREFCQWVVVRVVDGPWSREIARSMEGYSLERLAERVPTLDELLDHSIERTERHRLPADVRRGLPYVMVVPLRVHDQAVAAAAFVRADGQPGFGPMELTSIDEVAWRAAVGVERASLRRHARRTAAEAARRATRMRALVETAIRLRATGPTTDVARVLADPLAEIFPDRAVHVRLGSAGEGAHADDLVAPLTHPDGTPRGEIRVAADGSSSVDREIVDLLATLVTAALDAGDLTRALVAGEARWRALVEAVPVAIFEVGATDRRVRWGNRQAVAMLGWVGEAGEVPDALGEVLAPLWDRAASGGGRQRVDLATVAFGGRTRDLRLVTERVANEESDTLLTLVDDLTEWRLITEELRHAHAMELRGQVAGSIIHDFNNLLTLISGYGDLLGGRVRDDERPLVREIVAATERAAALTAQLQTLGRTRPSTPQVIRPGDVLRADEAIMTRIVGRSVTLRLAVEDESAILIDPDRFEQALLNLVLNARDAMPRGGTVTLTVTRASAAAVAARHSVATPGDVVVLRVRDTGVGMDEATRARCFEPLFTTKGLKGNGLGLAGVRRLMVESGGSIEVDSRPGEGAVFEIVLPVADEAPSAPAPATPLERAGDEVAPLTVLLVEDDAVQRHWVAQVIARRGHRVVEAVTAEAALELGGELEGVDLLVSDVSLGGMTGDALARELRARYPEIGVLLMSGTATASVVAGLEGAGFLTKPFAPSRLAEAISEREAGGSTPARSGSRRPAP